MCASDSGFRRVDETAGLLPLPKPSLTAVLHGLVGRSRVVFTVGRFIARGVAAETEIFRARIAYRPFAGFVREVKNGHTATFWQIDQTQGLGLWQGDLPLQEFDAGKSF